MLEEFPERVAGLGHAEACLWASDGRAEEAVGVMRRVVAHGRWWSDRQLADPDLAELQGLASYADLAETMGRHGREAVHRAWSTDPSLEVDVPQASPRGCTVVLHMATVSGHETAGLWHPVARSGWVIVSVESTLRDGDGMPCWDDPDLSRRDVRHAVEAAARIAKPVVLAGGSQGAGVAARLALDGTAGALAGFLAVAGAPAPGTWSLESPIPGILVGGSRDEFTLARQRRFREELSALGQEVPLITIPGLEHRYPDDWADLAPRLLRRIVH